MRGGAARTEYRSVDAGRVDTVAVRIGMAAGYLTLRGGAGRLLEARFTYNIQGWEPEVRYDVRDLRGYLAIEQPLDPGAATGVRYEWDLALGAGVPIDLRVEFAVGDGRLELGGLPLTGLAIERGVGNTTLDLRGYRGDDLGVRFSADVGNATMLLPADIGVVVAVTKKAPGRVNARGLRADGGAYANAAYRRAGTTMRIELEAGLGEVNLEVGG